MKPLALQRHGKGEMPYFTQAGAESSALASPVCDMSSTAISISQILDLTTSISLESSRALEACPDELCSLPLMSGDNQRVDYLSPLFVARRAASSVHHSPRKPLLIKLCPFISRNFKDHARVLSRLSRERRSASRSSTVSVPRQVRRASPRCQTSQTRVDTRYLQRQPRSSTISKSVLSHIIERLECHHQP